MTLSLSPAARALRKRGRPSAGTSRPGALLSLIDAMRIGYPPRAPGDGVLSGASLGDGAPTRASSNDGFRYRRRERQLPRRRLAGIDAPVDIGVAQHDLDVIVGLAEGNGFHELGGLPELAPGGPGFRTRQTSVVGGQRGFPAALQAVGDRTQVVRSQLQVHSRLK